MIVIGSGSAYSRTKSISPFRESESPPGCSLQASHGTRTQRVAIATPDAIKSRTMKLVIVKRVSFVAVSAQGNG
jgi:hypothetical protein